MWYSEVLFYSIMNSRLLEIINRSLGTISVLGYWKLFCKSIKNRAEFGISFTYSSSI